jgi:hypothetical protein
MPTVEAITDYALDKECDSLAEEIFDRIKDEAGLDFDPEDCRDDMMDAAHEAADMHQWVVYTRYALQICAHCNTDAGEEFVEDVGLPSPFTLQGAATAIAYGEMRYRIERAIAARIEESAAE